LGRGGSIDRIGQARLLVERRRRRLTQWVAARERRAAREAGPATGISGAA
jgi:hypothetical protein